MDSGFRPLTRWAAESRLLAGFIAGLISAGAVFLMTGPGFAAAEPALLWPLDLDRALSSTFGETRSTAFHAGIDLKTWGRTGYEVKAVASGHVTRIRTSPWGYGRAVYQKLRDGRIVVYAHLESFSPALARRVRAAQKKAGRYTVDLWLKEGELPVARGEVIARSGESGAGPPHLHLEIRDAGNVPVNPLLHGYSVTDTKAPSLQRIALVPMDHASRVNGRPHPVSLKLSPDGAGKFSAPGPVRVHGRIGIAVEGYDRADAAANKLAPLGNRLLVDGVERFSARYASVSYSDGYQMRLDRFRISSGGALRTFFNLFRLPGNRLPFYRPKGEAAGILKCGGEPGSGSEPVLGKGPHLLEIESVDAAGNKATARCRLLVNADPAIMNPRLLPADGNGLFAEMEIADADDDRVAVSLSLVEGGKARPVVRQEVRVGRGPYSFALEEGGPGAVWKLAASDPDGGRDSVILTAAPSASARLISAPVEAHGEYVTVAMKSGAPLSAAPTVSLEVKKSGTSRRPVPGIEEALRLRQTGPLEFELIADLRALRGAAAGLMGAPGLFAGPVSLLVAAPAHRPSERLEIPVNLRPAVPGEAVELAFAEGAVSLRFAATSAYGPLYPQATPFTATGTKELISTGPGYAFGPVLASFDGHVEVTFRVPEDGRAPGKLALYRQRKGGWGFAGNRLSRGSTRIGAKVRHLGRFAVLADETAPAISGLAPSGGAVLDRSPGLVSARVVDHGSGIGSETDLVMEVDGAGVIFEYDPEARVLRYRPEADLQPGRHMLRVAARDRCGNEAEMRAEFRVR